MQWPQLDFYTRRQEHIKSDILKAKSDWKSFAVQNLNKVKLNRPCISIPNEGMSYGYRWAFYLIFSSHSLLNSEEPIYRQIWTLNNLIFGFGDQRPVNIADCPINIGTAHTNETLSQPNVYNHIRETPLYQCHDNKHIIITSLTMKLWR